MAIENYVSLSSAEGYRRRPIDNHGKFRTIYNKFVAAVAGDIGSTLQLGKLPPGAVRLYYPDAFIACSAWGAARTLSIGYAAFRSKQDGAVAGDGIEPASANALANALDVSAAARIPWSATLMKYDFYSLAGVDIVGTVAGGTFPLNGTLEVWIPYIYE